MTLITRHKIYTIATAFVASSGDMRFDGFKSLDPPILGGEGGGADPVDIALR